MYILVFAILFKLQLIQLQFRLSQDVSYIVAENRNLYIFRDAFEKQESFQAYVVIDNEYSVFCFAVDICIGCIRFECLSGIDHVFDSLVRKGEASDYLCDIVFRHHLFPKPCDILGVFRNL